MENKNYQFEDVIVNFNEEEAEDVTNDIKLACRIKYRDSIKKVLKQGKLYKIFFCFSYTAFGEEIRFARSKSEVMWYSRIATEEKELGKTYEDYIQEFIRNNIDFDGIHIPPFIDIRGQRKK
jgi:hypothetical protein